MPSPRFLLLLPLCLCACAASKWTLQNPGPLGEDQKALLAKAEKSYRKGEDLDEFRRQIVADPAAAWWWTRLVVRDVVTVREGRIGAEEQSTVTGREFEDRVRAGRIGPNDGTPLLRATAGIKDPVEHRALTELAALGEASVPCLVLDLAQHPQGFVRQNGIDLLARIGSPALPLVRSQLVQSDMPAHRRTGARVLGEIDPQLAFDDLARLAVDPDYAVRAAALTSLGEGGEAAAGLLRARLVADEDAFVRRSAVRALGAHRSRQNAEAICNHLERCQKERDKAGCEAAQDALQDMAKARGVRSLDAWRRFAAGLDAGARSVGGAR